MDSSELLRTRKCEDLRKWGQESLTRGSEACLGGAQELPRLSRRRDTGSDWGRSVGLRWVLDWRTPLVSYSSASTLTGITPDSKTLFQTLLVLCHPAACVLHRKTSAQTSILLIFLFNVIFKNGVHGSLNCVVVSRGCALRKPSTLLP